MNRVPAGWLAIEMLDAEPRAVCNGFTKDLKREVM
jgi:hypothetical protein